MVGAGAGAAAKAAADWGVGAAFAKSDVTAGGLLMAKENEEAPPVPEGSVGWKVKLEVEEAGAPKDGNSGGPADGLTPVTALAPKAGNPDDAAGFAGEGDALPGSPLTALAARLPPFGCNDANPKPD